MCTSIADNPFTLLGVIRSSSQADIRLGYIRAMREAHPDRGGSDSAAATLNAAYTMVRNEHARVEWSQTRELFGKTQCVACDGRGGIISRSRSGRRTVVCVVCKGSGYS